MFLSKIKLSPEGRKDYELMRRLSDRYKTHKIMYDLLCNGDERDFLYRDEDKRTPTYLAYTPERPQIADEWWDVQTKPFPLDTLKEGRVFRFNIEFNSTLRPAPRDDDIDVNRNSRHDIVMHRKHILSEKGVPRDEWPSEADFVQQEGRKWFERRADDRGFELDTLRILFHREHRLEKEDYEHKLSTMWAEGVLTVKDAPGFQSMIKNGLGHAKTYGCGLMTVRPANAT